jgi:hypothetical protein
MFGKDKGENIDSAYREETVTSSIYVLLVALVVVAAPLGWLTHRIGAEGLKAADVSRYSSLTVQVAQKVKVAQAMLEQESMDEAVVAEIVAPSVRLITPDIAPTNIEEVAMQDPEKLDIELNAIYWSPRDPLVTIDDESYRVGDKIKGYTIVEIRKTEVIFKSPLGETVIKYFYEYLDQSKSIRR